MGRYVLRRVLQTVPVVIGTTFIIFAMVFALPGDPIRALAGDKFLAPSVVAQLHAQYHLDDPLPLQYAKYMNGLAHGDFGRDFNGEKVSTLIQGRWPVTVKLGLTAWVLETLFGVFLGLVAGLRRGGVIDRAVLVATTVVISVPALVLAFMAQFFLGVKLGVFPIAGVADGWPVSYLLPAAILAALDLAFIARLTRTNLIENRRADFVRTAIAKGLGPWRVVGKHMLRNSLIPVVTYLALSFGYLMSGTVIVEGIFNLPGLGNLVFGAIQRQEGSVVVGVSTLLVLVFVFTNLIVDILYGVLDPRIRYD
ncbi:MAG TPA: ABC transporter permease [Gaiellaceae bacterium]|jgi:peptide/nickel transport system permease protein/oligopeptide transport system permease protein